MIGMDRKEKCKNWPQNAFCRPDTYKNSSFRLRISACRPELTGISYPHNKRANYKQNKGKPVAAGINASQLQNIPLFSGLDDNELDEIVAITSKRSYPKNNIIINEGDETDSLYLIISGKVKVILSDEDGKEITICILEPNDYFGELSLIDDEPRSARVVTTEQCQFCIIHKSDFNHVLDNNPGLVRNMMKGLSKRLRQANKNIESLALMDVYGRVARTLLQFSKPEEDGTRIIAEKLTQKDIASMVGASREMVSRIFKDLTTGGYITVKSGIITITEKLPAHY